jgi:hypothetical protein
MHILVITHGINKELNTYIAHGTNKKLDTYATVAHSTDKKVNADAPKMH